MVVNEPAIPTRWVKNDPALSDKTENQCKASVESLIERGLIERVDLDHVRLTPLGRECVQELTRRELRR